jgi:hypothetical protein
MANLTYSAQLRAADRKTAVIVDFGFAKPVTGREKKLEPCKFVRVRRGGIVKVSHIHVAQVMMTGVYELEPQDGLRLGTSRQGMVGNSAASLCCYAPGPCAA